MNNRYQNLAEIGIRRGGGLRRQGTSRVQQQKGARAARAKNLDLTADHELFLGSCVFVKSISRAAHFTLIALRYFKRCLVRERTRSLGFPFRMILSFLLPAPRCTAAVSLGLLAVSGCALLDTGGWTSAGLGTVNSAQTLFKPIGNSVPDAMELEYILVARPVGDPLLGDALWGELDQIGAMRPEKRKTLADHGFKVGISGSNAPTALEKILGSADELLDHTAQEDARKLRGHRLLLRSGGQTEACVGESEEERQMKFELAGENVSKSFPRSRCLFRVTARAQQEGWATFEFLPEVHFGVPRLRPVAEESSWELRPGQEVQKLINQRFELTLNDGEMAVITCTGNDHDRPGTHFFRSTVDGVPVQRLIIVRLISARKNTTVATRN